MERKRIAKILSISTLIIICHIVLFTYIQYNDYKTYESRYKIILKNVENERNGYIQTVLIENKNKVETVLKIYKIQIHNTILKEYKENNNLLINDILNPTNESKLSKILDNTLGEIYINVDNSANKPLVISSDKIIWNRSICINNNILNDFINKQYNQKLCKAAIYSVLNNNIQKNDIIFWEIISSPLNTHKKIENMSLYDLIFIYNKEGLQSLKSYELLVPAYITNEGDLFGTKDLNNIGIKNKNYKIIIIQRVNIYDALKPYSKDILYYENNINKIQTNIDINKKERAKSIEISLILIVFIIIGSGYLQNRLYVEDKN